jgi:hypothetical protein
LSTSLYIRSWLTCNGSYQQTLSDQSNGSADKTTVMCFTIETPVGYIYTNIRFIVVTIHILTTNTSSPSPMSEQQHREIYVSLFNELALNGVGIQQCQKRSNLCIRRLFASHTNSRLSILFTTRPAGVSSRMSSLPALPLESPATVTLLVSFRLQR